MTRNQQTIPRPLRLERASRNEHDEISHTANDGGSYLIDRDRSWKGGCLSDESCSKLTWKLEEPLRDGRGRREVVGVDDFKASQRA